MLFVGDKSEVITMGNIHVSKNFSEGCKNLFQRKGNPKIFWKKLQKIENPGLNPIKKIWVLRNFLTKNDNFEPANFFRKFEKFSNKIFWCCCLDRFLKIFLVIWRQSAVLNNDNTSLVFNITYVMMGPNKLSNLNW